MEKKEYITIRFKQDFLKYSLLQEDSASAYEIADELFQAIDTKSFTAPMKQKAKELCETHLSMEKLKVNGKFSNTLPEELKPEIKDKLKDEYATFIGPLADAYLEKAKKKLMLKLDQLIWNHGIIRIPQAIDLFVQKLQRKADENLELSTTSLKVSEEKVMRKYADAKRITLMELIQGNNIDDILYYRNSLENHVVSSCECLMYGKIYEFYKALAGLPTWKELGGKFEGIKQNALIMKDSLPILEPNTDWEKEYSYMVPTAFYERNISNITAEQAFHYVLLHIFARREPWLIENGFLENGVLKLYTNNKKFDNDAFIQSMLDELK